MVAKATFLATVFNQNFPEEQDHLEMQKALDLMRP